MFEKLFDVIIPVLGGIFCIYYSKKIENATKKKIFLFCGIAMLVLSLLLLIFF